MTQTIFLGGASRGLGLGLAHTFLAKGWNVIATTRAESAGLRALEGERLRIETLDITSPPSVAALAARLAGVKIDIVFIVAGRLSSWDAPIHAMSHEEIAQDFITNSTAPVSAAEAFVPLLVPGGTIVFMTSLLGSIASNTGGGGIELYRASKAALNMLASCFAIRHKTLPVLLMHPGWVRTDMGGPQAPLDVETSTAGMASVITASHPPGIAYLDYSGKTLPW